MNRSIEEDHSPKYREFVWDCIKEVTPTSNASCVVKNFSAIYCKLQIHLIKKKGFQVCTLISFIFFPKTLNTK